MTTRMLSTTTLLAAAAVTAAALGLSLAVPPGNADADTLNWLRTCKSTHTTHIVTACTVRYPIQPHHLDVLDTAGNTHRFSSAASVWSFVHQHSVPCKTAASSACYSTDPVMHAHAITLATRQSFLTTFFHA